MSKIKYLVAGLLSLGALSASAESVTLEIQKIKSMEHSERELDQKHYLRFVANAKSSEVTYVIQNKTIWCEIC